MQNETAFIPHLFRREFSKMVTVISKLFGLQYVELAEDIVSETFLIATETWGIKGIPPNPTAWLYTVAKNKTLEYLRRDKVFAEKVSPALILNEQAGYQINLDFSKQNIQDSQLQMLFAICNPIIPDEAQIGLALRILCGFGIDEIAEAFLSNKETINKRLYRAREKLREAKVALEMPAEQQVNQRLDNVLHTIYLLFNEGYNSTTQSEKLRTDMCLEAMRLGVILTGCESTNLHKTNALIALMCFHASRFNARFDNNNDVVLYEDQDETLWDKELIKQGNYYLHLSVGGTELTSYHIEAAIAQMHSQKADTPQKWEHILQLYNQLLLINYSPSVALNRTFALYKARGAAQAITEAEKLQLTGNYFYFTLLGELYKDIDKKHAKLQYQKAHALAKTKKDKDVIQQKIAVL
ncbi:sigma-70 family RNA polymerase sigma factor [Mucilaginibacter sp. HMF5004]|uniref:RNA polymerase sigma factor n=1 Tax=Mucilaginibacter rivuli TaxID=2857527 RepID=UPI001C5F83D0|nr:sigma-70 family RNA polymerase sigma factor [Mucilaginibacter rivuli]MBW4890975.1 sigma-70 family RNA polymerase sigma factor [Mucilaginibacter rivuli]